MSLGKNFANAAKAYFEAHQGEIVGDARSAITSSLHTLFKPQIACVDVIEFTDSTCKRWTPSVHVCWPSGETCDCCGCAKKVFGKCVVWDPPSCHTDYSCADTTPVCVEWNPVKVCSCVLNCW